MCKEQCTRAYVATAWTALHSLCGSHDKSCGYLGGSRRAWPYLSNHLVVRVSGERNALQGSNSPGKQRHVGRYREGYLERGVQEVLGQHLRSSSHRAG